MLLRVRVSRVDDYAGELTQALEKLEAEQARGVQNREEQEDFLADLRKAVEAHDLRPMRRRAQADFLLAALTALAAAFLPARFGFHHAPVLCLLALCLVSLAMATWRCTLYYRRSRHDQRWLHQLEAALAASGSIFKA